MKPVIEESGLIFNARKHGPAEQAASFTTLCPLRSGTLLCSFQLGPEKNSPTSTIRICRSRDAARSWEELPFQFETCIDGAKGSFSVAEMVEIELGRVLIFATWFDRSDPKRPLFDPDTGGILRSKQLLAESTDEGDTWTAWRQLSTGELTACAATGPVIRGTDGTIGFAFESFKEYDDPSPAIHGAWLILSGDGGQTFSDPYLVAQHPRDELYYWDQRLCLDANTNELVGMFWTHDLRRKKDLSVHLCRRRLDQPDGHGPTYDTGISGQIAAPLSLDDGRLLAFVVDRNRPATMKLWTSADGGKSWPEEDCLTVYNHDEQGAITQGAEEVDFNEYWEDMRKWTFGHPSIRSLGEGRVLLAFYAGEPDYLDIHWARVKV